jgi:hypothetical protein
MAKSSKDLYTADSANPQVYYYTGPPGPPGPFGPPGKQGDLNDTATSFVYAQLAQVIKQVIRYYPTTVVTSYSTGFSVTGLQGTPVELYASPDGTYGGLFVVQDNTDVGAMPLQAISAIALSDGSVYNPALTYLSKPVFPNGYDTNIVTAIHDYLPLFTPVVIYAGALIQITGIIYKNVYGMLVVADDTSGNNPVFVPITNITAIIPTFNTLSGKAAAGNSNLVITNKV